MIASTVYGLSALTSIACAILLLRSYRRGRNRLLLWSGICFIGLSLNNILATIDVNTASSILDLSTLRLAVSIMSVGVLIYGLTWELH